MWRRDPKKVVERDERFISQSYTRTYPMVVDRGYGATLWDIEGKSYIDFSSCIAVANTGHTNPDVVRAIKTQAGKILHNAGTDFYNVLGVEVAERLNEITPGNFAKKVFFTNSGTETVECAMKLSRWFKKKPLFISFLGSFHGRTFGSMTLSASKSVQREFFDPLVPGVFHTPYAYCYRCPFSSHYPSCNLACLDYLEHELLGVIVPKEEVAAIFVEPVQGESGYIVPPRTFHKRLQRICKRNDFLLVADEIQTGFCRSGRWFASDVFGITPDIICLAKAIAGGLPLGACVARKNIMTWPRGAHASTFSGNPLACAASLANIRYMKEKKLWKRAEALGNHGLRRLKRMKSEFSAIGDVRGLGLMLALEIVKDRESKEPDRLLVNRILNRAFESGLLLLSGGKSSIRIAPPLVITREKFDEGLEILENVLRKI